MNVLAEEFPAEERPSEVEKYIAELKTWLKGIDELRRLKRRARVTSEDVHSINEWLTLMCYFAYRTYNETMEQFTLQGWLDPQPNDRLQRGAKADAKAEMPTLEGMMTKLGTVYDTLGEKPNRFSKHYHALVYDDASWSIKKNQTGQFEGLYNQAPMSSETSSTTSGNFNKVGKRGYRSTRVRLRGTPSSIFSKMI